MTHLATRIVRHLSWSAYLIFCGLAFSQNGVLRVTEPTPSKDGTIITSDPAIYLKGTLTSAGEDRRVLWESNRGFSDLATVTLADDRRTVLWRSSSPVPLRPGINHVRIKAIGQPGAGAFVNVFYTPQSSAPPPALGTTIFHGQQITYEVRDGLAIYQSDMILGKAADIAAAALNPPVAAHANSAKGLRPDALTIAPNFSSPTGLWPVVNGVARVPYTIANASTDAIYPLINDAITESNTQLAGVVQWEPATASDVNRVNFDFNTADNSGACEAAAGMVGGTQTIGGSGACTTTTILHEMGHALGLFHEQSRADRNTYVNFMEQNIDKPNHGNFDMFPWSVDSGLYNYASIMEYGPFIIQQGWCLAHARNHSGRDGARHQPAPIHHRRSGWNHAPVCACAERHHSGHESYWVAGHRGWHTMHGSVRFQRLDHRFPAHSERAPGREQSNATSSQRPELYFREVERRGGECPIRHGNELSRQWHAAKSLYIPSHH